MKNTIVTFTSNEAEMFQETIEHINQKDLDQKCQSIIDEIDAPKHVQYTYTIGVIN